MKEKVDNLKEAYKYLRSIGKIHTKKEFSIEIDVDYTNLSSAFGGAERYLTDGLFRKICDKYDDIFNVDYFLTGNGDMIKGKNIQKNEVENNKGIVGIQGNGHTIHNSPNDINNLTEMLKDKDYIIAKLRKQIEDKHNSLVERLNDKDKFIEKLITDRDELIKKMMDREADIVKNSYDRNKENLVRMDTMHEKMFKLQDSLISLINKMNNGNN
ncbi:hypothetical protein FACS189426_06150 [Bacteroidia bacterium]|nr:hypothetical protein FACS189426_06150 [Bacteroidia bacterium]GHV71243.1 hypothetical protein FACS189420_5630 [Bacteroidia bacterium]